MKGRSAYGRKHFRAGLFVSSNRLGRGLKTRDTVSVVDVSSTSSVIGLGLRKNGDELIIGSREGVFHIWNCHETDSKRRTLTFLKEWDIWDDKQYVRDFALSANGAGAVSLSKEANHFVWDSQTGREMDYYLEPDISDCFELSPNGKMLASSLRGCIFLWNTHPMKPEGHLESNLAQCRIRLCFSSDGRRLLAFNFGNRSPGRDSHSLPVAGLGLKYGISILERKR